MGLNLSITFADSPPSWERAQTLLANQGWGVQMRMIDGQLAFPDEQPPEQWRELRVAAAQGGMVTIRRDGSTIQCVIWGNADKATKETWNALAWAFAAAGQGLIHIEQAALSADQFRLQAELPKPRS